MPNATDILTCVPDAAQLCPVAGPSNSQAYFELAVSPSSGSNLHSEFLGAYIYLSDNDNPTISNASPAPTTNWQKTDTFAPALTSQDAGLGLGNVNYGHFGSAIEQNIDNAGYSSALARGSNCDGGPARECDGSYTAYYGNQPAPKLQGERSIKYRSRDVIGHASSELAYTLRLDNELPTVSIGGRLEGLLQQDGYWGSATRVPRTITRTMPFNIRAIDGTGTGATARSGVKTATWNISRAQGGGGNNPTDIVGVGASVTNDKTVPRICPDRSCPMTSSPVSTTSTSMYSTVLATAFRSRTSLRLASVTSRASRKA
jgi:hypothetical protein